MEGVSTPRGFSSYVVQCMFRVDVLRVKIVEVGSYWSPVELALLTPPRGG